MEEKRIIFLDYLRVIACFMVMVVHSCEGFYFDAEGNTFFASLGDAAWVSIIDSAMRACVPLFVIASAFLLFPLKRSTSDFFKRRLVRVLVPFLVWSGVYIVWNALDFSKGLDTSAVVGNLKRLCFNFPMTTGGHLWFVPMLLGLYLAMPLLSPWAEKASEKEVRGWLFVWLATTLFPYVRKIWAVLFAASVDVNSGTWWAHTFGVGNFDNIPFLWGECPWNSFGTFQYVSGFIGYLLLGLWFRKFAPDFSTKKAFAIAIPCWLAGWLLVALPFFLRIPSDAGYPVKLPYALAVDLEMSWEFCSLGVALTVFAYFLMIRRLGSEGVFYRKLVRPLSEASYGTYLMHMLILTPVLGAYRAHLPTPATIVLTAATTFVCASTLSIGIRKLPKIGKFICG